MNVANLQHYINTVWDDSVLSTLMSYIEIPNKSPMFDPHWQQHGHMEKAVALLAAWVEQHRPHHATIDVLTSPGKTPCLVIDVPGNVDETVLLYGHLDKQPEMSGWAHGLGPWQPVLKDNRLYGRGGADDGYALFASVLAINALQQQAIPHARCIILIEASEESGSVDLPYYMDRLAPEIGEPSLIVCLDSGAGNYEQLWMTTSLRGNIVGELTVEVLSEGVHSGNASGIVPDSFRIARQLLNRIEDENSGQLLLPSLQVTIPPSRITQARHCADVLGEGVKAAFPFQLGAKAMAEDACQLILNRTWRGALTVTGASGLPALEDAGNVLRPKTTLKLSIRTPPTCDTQRAYQALESALLASPPYQAKVTFKGTGCSQGWHAPELKPWLENACQQASKALFGKAAMYMGEGGTIPFMSMLGQRFPNAQFMITGVLGPHSNAHGPNEFLDIEMAKKLTACVAVVLKQHVSSGKSH